MLRTVAETRLPKGIKPITAYSRPKSSTLAFSLAVQNAKQGHQNVKQQPPVPRGS